MGVVPASLAVSNTAEGLTLKTQLDNLLFNVENKKFFNEFMDYSLMNDSGTVIID